MPDDAINHGSEPARNLPVPVVRPSPAATAPSARGFSESWIGRVARSMFGWKPGSIRADLEIALGSPPVGDTEFTLTERTLLKNILGLREQRIEDVMVPRADIVAVPHEVAL